MNARVSRPVIYVGMFLMLLLAGCGNEPTAITPATQPLPSATLPPPSATNRPATATATATPTELHVTPTQPPATATQPRATAVITLQPLPFPLSETGPYKVGKRGYRFFDASREDKEVQITVWYPALKPKGASDSGVSWEAAPDMSGAPYPLILSSTKAGNIFAQHLASYGFVAAGIDGLDSADTWEMWIIDYPLDFLFVLSQISSAPLKALDGMVDVENAGVMGYSFDGYDALALSGARVDPEYYMQHCAQASTMQPALEAWWIKYICTPAGNWDKYVARAGTAITTSQDGLWQAMTDQRIRAVMPMAPEGAWLFGERGLAAVDRPMLIIGATADDLNYYDLEAAYIYEHLGTPERGMVSFVGRGHMMIWEPERVAEMRHFATAFFGYYLQGRNEFAALFSDHFVNQQQGLAWGVFHNP